MNRLVIGLAVGLGTFAIAEASKAIDAKKAKAKAEAKAKADAKQRAKQVVEQRAAAAKKMADIESQRLKERLAELDRGIEERAMLRRDLKCKALQDKYIGLYKELSKEQTALKHKALDDKYIIS